MYLLSASFCVRDGMQGANKIDIISDFKKLTLIHHYVYLRIITVSTFGGS